MGMLRSVLIACSALFIAITQSQPIAEIPEESSTSKLDVHSSEIAVVPLKADDKVEDFMNDHSEAIRKIISEQEFAIGDEQQPSKDEHRPNQNEEELDEETKAKCKYYYELFQQKYAELQSQENHGHRYKDIVSGSKEDKMKSFGETAKIEPQVAQSNKYHVNINNFDTQDLPYPEQNFFNLNPDQTIQKPNSKGPVPDSIPILINNGYQYVPLMEQDYLQPPLESKPVQFNNEHQEYMKLSPLALQNSLVSDGKMIYVWYKALPNYQIYSPTTNNNDNIYNANHMLPAIYGEMLTSTSTSTTSTTEATTTASTTTKATLTENPIKLEGYKQYLYEPQLKFVFPVQYPKPDSVNVPSYDIDPYAYYPREFQPNFMNIKMSYFPTYHMIKRLTVPNEHNTEVGVRNPLTKSY